MSWLSQLIGGIFPSAPVQPPPPPPQVIEVPAPAPIIKPPSGPGAQAATAARRTARGRSRRRGGVRGLILTPLGGSRTSALGG